MIKVDSIVFRLFIIADAACSILDPCHLSFWTRDFGKHVDVGTQEVCRSRDFDIRRCPFPCWISADNLPEGFPHVVSSSLLHNHLLQCLLVALTSSDIHAETLKEAIHSDFQDIDACGAVSIGRY